MALRTWQRGGYPVRFAQPSPYAALGATMHWDAQFGIQLGAGAGISMWTDRIGKMPLSQPSAALQLQWSSTDTAFADAYSVSYDGTQYNTGAGADLLALFNTANPSYTLASVELEEELAGSAQASFAVTDVSVNDAYAYWGSAPPTGNEFRYAAFLGGSFRFGQSTGALPYNVPRGRGGDGVRRPHGDVPRRRERRCGYQLRSRLYDA